MDNILVKVKEGAIMKIPRNVAIQSFLLVEKMERKFLLYFGMLL